MSNIAKTSEALQARIRELCGDQLREVGTHPGHWDDSAVRHIVRNPPAAYVVWLGHVPGEHPHVVQARWAVYVVANVLDGQRQNDPGIYQLVEKLSAGLHRCRIAPSGTFDVVLRQAAHLSCYRCKTCGPIRKAAWAWRFTACILKRRNRAITGEMMAQTKITLLAPHKHAGKQYQAGEVLSVDEQSAKFILNMGIGKPAEPVRKNPKLNTEDKQNAK
ncbi:DUF1834 domain-containing protein [[Haemophilus] ducreyi]|uniref:DUF7210 domain-containing protein n=3 Tax=Haemophilus ducreyi TaxID=730 RepID=Q7VPF0_HAEDU|nr:DUF1834 family protein [[Haemophilus] ducreyi]AAP95131.1 hypothetical protein HD_0135 [[Haemophilus] ducreyi 35000HP]ASE06709.1 DUF1834 domain-containing protein [[Haemophilus] ducreyi]